MKVVAIVPAAGLGRRLKSSIPKPLVKIDSAPILIHTLNRINSHPKISSIIVAVPKGYLKAVSGAVKHYRLYKVKSIIKGGATRAQSVKNCLKELTRDTDLVLIHDGVRPFITDKIIDEAINAAKGFGASVTAVPVKPTLKSVYKNKGYFVAKTLDRKNIWEIQTPQVFKSSLILKAYSRLGKSCVSDDASLVERMGKKIKLVMGSYFNIKITTAEDLVFAKAILRCNIKSE